MKLPPDEQLQLASELVESAARVDDLHELSEAAVHRLESELAAVVRDPSKGTKWEDLIRSRRGWIC